MEIVSQFAKDGVLVINGDDEKLVTLHKNDSNIFRTVTAGTAEWNDFRVISPRYTSDTTLAFDIKHEDATVSFDIPAAGMFSGITAALTSAVCNELGMDLTETAEALTHLQRTPHRLQLTENRGIKVIDDTYNASPDSMRSGLAYLMSVNGSRKIAVLAGMNELGANAADLHRTVGETAAQMGIDLLLTVGDKAKDIAAGAKGVEKVHVNDNAAAIAFLSAYRKDGDVFLIKGSRTMKMEDIAAAMSKGD
jgi:UDP-N-acetylmuramoyl-tripeptide--D-alanyl-D-alanine ligase